MEKEQLLNFLLNKIINNHNKLKKIFKFNLFKIIQNNFKILTDL